MTSKQKFEKYFEKNLSFFHQNYEKEYNFEFNKKNYKIDFVYSLFYLSMFINNDEIYIYKRDEIITFKKSNIINFRKKNNMNYNELYSLFRKINKRNKFSITYKKRLFH